VGLGGEGVPEKNQNVDFMFGNQGANLLVATKWAADKFGDGEARIGLYQAARRACGIEVVRLQPLDVLLAPI